jgi:hypothetical protein
VDNGIIEHNNRSIIAKNVDASRISDNIIYRQTDIKEFYQQIFGEALAEYNTGFWRETFSQMQYRQGTKQQTRLKKYFVLPFIIWLPQ